MVEAKVPQLRCMSADAAKLDEAVRRVGTPQMLEFFLREKYAGPVVSAEATTAVATSMHTQLVGPLMEQIRILTKKVEAAEVARQEAAAAEQYVYKQILYSINNY